MKRLWNNFKTAVKEIDADITRLAERLHNLFCK